MSRLDDAVRARGVVTHSSGNHGRALAWSAREFAVPATVVVPRAAVPAKVAAVRELGARVVEVAAADREAGAAAEVERTGGTLVPPYDHPHVIAGQGTVGSEILVQVPDAAVVLVPVGGGGLISGIAAALAGSGVRVVGVEPAEAADAAQSLRLGRRCRWPAERTARTAADGLRSTTLGELTWPHVRDLVDDVITVDETEIREAVVTLHAHGVPAEPSGAVATAGWLSHRAALPPGRAVAVVSGGNADPDWLASVLGAH